MGDLGDSGIETGATARPVLERLPTGIAGLDEVLDGGLVRGGVHLVGGRPGTGKTTLGNHLAYNRATAGEVAIIATVLAETHTRMLAHLGGFGFFDPTHVARRVHYVSLFDELTANGLGGVIDLLRRLVREHRVRLLVIDGAGVFEEFAPSPVAFRRFTAELNTQLSALDCTAVLLIDHDTDALQAIGFHVDGIIVLEDRSIGLRDVRLLHVVKLRGVRHLRGRHHFAITAAGFEVYPRLEAALPQTAPRTAGAGGREPFGVAGLDNMVRGGLVAGSTTLLLGSPGTGKTITGLHFVVTGAERGQPGLIVGFHEPPPQLVAKATALGLPLARHLASGLVRIVWNAPQEVLLDAWARAVLATIAEHGARRLFIDSLNDVQRLALFPERLPAFLSTLENEFRTRAVTSIYAAEINTLVGSDVEVPPRGMPTTVDNAILLRYVELHSQLRRLISIVKLRQSAYDTSIREFAITERGLEVAETFASAEAILTGVARLGAKPAVAVPDDPGAAPPPAEEIAP